MHLPVQLKYSGVAPSLMQRLLKDRLAEMARGRVKPRLLSEIKMPVEDVYWEDSELVACWDKNAKKGLIIIELSELYIVAFELGKKIADSRTGRTKPIICDLCYTWQQGGKATTVTCKRGRDGHTFTYLCCADLKCSLHIRDKTAEAILSRAHIREDIDIERRAIRLKQKLQKLISTLELLPITKH